MGDLYFQQGKFSEALTAYQQAKQLHQVPQWKSEQIQDLARIGDVHKQQGNLALAEDGTLARLLAHHLPDRLLEQNFGSVTNHDDRAALVCAITALGVASIDYTAVGDGDGWIILPPAAFIADWARPLVTSWNQATPRAVVTSAS